MTRLLCIVSGLLLPVFAFANTNPVPPNTSQSTSQTQSDDQAVIEQTTTEDQAAQVAKETQSATTPKQICEKLAEAAQKDDFSAFKKYAVAQGQWQGEGKGR